MVITLSIDSLVTRNWPRQALAFVPSLTLESVIISMEPEICLKMLRNLSEKPAAKFSVTTLSYSMVKIAPKNMVHLRF